MEIVLLLLLPVVICVALVLYFRRKDLRATAVVDIPPNGPPRVNLWSKGAAAEELARLGLTYGSKIRWLLPTEGGAAEEQFELLTSEIRDAWSSTTDSLIENMPTGRDIRDIKERPLAVPGGETFSIRYLRTDYRKSSIKNNLPSPGLANNIVWNYVILMDAIHRKCDQPTKHRAARAIELWWDTIFLSDSPDTSLKGLNQLINEADLAWERSGVKQPRGVDTRVAEDHQVPEPPVGKQEATDAESYTWNREVSRIRSRVTLTIEAAEQGVAMAQAWMGSMYAKGEGVSKDYQEAARWFRLAADQGDANAQSFLGLVYYGGEGVPQDYQESARWFRAAAEQGQGQSQYALGEMYAKGEGVPEDDIQAYMWANLAASRLTGDTRQKSVELKDTIAKLLTPEQIAEAQRLSREWKPKQSGSQ